MPTNPTSPVSNAAVDRLTLGVDSPRGAQPSVPGPDGFRCMCFEAEASGPFACMASICFEAEASSLLQCAAFSGCFEAE